MTGGEEADVDRPIEIRRAVLDDLLAHARQAAPLECCGILVGTPGRIERSVRARNTLGSPTRYQIDPADQIAAMRSARDRGETVVGFYHSHPASPPMPSDTDRSEAAYPGHCYLIVSPGAGDAESQILGFRLHASGNFLPVRLVPTP